MVVPLLPMVETAVARFVKALDRAAPGLIEAFYVTGSAAMGDFRVGSGLARWGPSGAGASDVDYVAVTTEPLEGAAMRKVTGAQRRSGRMPGWPGFDGVYLTWADLANDPATVLRRPQGHGRRLGMTGRGHPVLWHELAQHGVAVRGPCIAAVPVWTDPDRLVAWVRGNLDGYWRQWHDRSRVALSRPGLASLTSWATAWSVLGVSRVHYTIRSGAICSKSDGGRYARHAFGPEWRPLLDEALRIRHGRPGPSRFSSPVARGRAALEFVQMVVDDGVAR